MKRRKTKASSEGGGHDEKKAVSLKSLDHTRHTDAHNDIHSKTKSSEEFEIERHDPGKDLDTFQRVCAQIKQLIVEIHDLRMKGKDVTNPEVSEKRVQCTLLFVMLRKLNRIAHMRNKKARDSTQETKQKVDSLHLQLQNLLYEVMHIKKEINKCLEFKSKDEEIDLVSEKEFYSEAPESISNPSVTSKNSHQLMLARLDWELQQRKLLATRKEEYLNEKDDITQEIETQKEYLDSLKPRLEKLLKVAVPIQEYMSLPNVEAQKIQFETAQFLPSPLYIMFVQAKAYGEACDSKLEVNIIGDIEAAKAEMGNKPIDRGGMVSDSDGEGAGELTEAEERRRKKRKRAAEKSRLEEKRKSLLKSHPLQILLKLNCKNQAEVSITLSYHPALNIVTTMVSLMLLKETDVPTLTNISLLSADSVLSCLFPGDLGTDTPNSANHYQLEALGMEEFSSYCQQIGYPYIWAQKICGLRFLPGETPEAPAASLSSSHMEATIRAIKNRIVARLALQGQLAELETSSIPLNKSTALIFPDKLNCHFKSWHVTTYSDFVELSHTKSLLESGMLSEHDMFFTAKFERNTATLHAAVTVPIDYPVRPPLFGLNITCGKQQVTTGNTIKSMEAEVNVFYDELLIHDSRNILLSNQLRRLQMCFDIFCESGQLQNTSSFEQCKCEKLFLRGRRGRDRGIPYKYNAEQKFFTHR